MLCTELSGTGEGLETLGCPDSPPWSPHPCQHQHPASSCSPPPAIGVSLGWAPSSHGALGGGWVWPAWVPAFLGKLRVQGCASRSVRRAINYCSPSATDVLNMLSPSCVDNSSPLQSVSFSPFLSLFFFLPPETTIAAHTAALCCLIKSAVKAKCARTARA